MDALERRVAQLEQNQTSISKAQPLLITSVGAEDHFGNFAVESAGEEMVLNRAPGESSAYIQARLHQLAFEKQRSRLRIIFIFPATTEWEAKNA